MSANKFNSDCMIKKRNHNGVDNVTIELINIDDTIIDTSKKLKLSEVLYISIMC
jgi:hypothetical protein